MFCVGVIGLSDLWDLPFVHAQWLCWKVAGHSGKCFTYLVLDASELTRLRIQRRSTSHQLSYLQQERFGKE